MWQIFGDTDDITFGIGMPTTQRTRPDTSSLEQWPIAPRRDESIHDSKIDDWVRRDHRERSAVPRQQSQARPASTDRSRPSLSRVPFAPPEKQGPGVSLARLVDSMKPTYLPEIHDGAIRIVLLSDASLSDPFMLLRSGDTTLLLGTGYTERIHTGITYPTLPDMRLAYSERDRLVGWILTLPWFDIVSFQMTFELLGAPYIYANRDVIAYIRDSITDAVFLEKCRFFEIFPVDTDERKIGDFLLKQVSNGLSITVSWKKFIDTLHTIEDLSVESSWSDILSKSWGEYSIGDTSFLSGEIIDVWSGKITKHSLKFTFDTFYRDANSIWVVAGYALKDRLELASSGVLTFVIEEDPRARAIVGHIFIDSRGFVHSYEMMSVHKEVLKWIRHTYEQAILANPRIERGELVQTIRREITKYCYLITGRTPVVMPIIIER